MITMTMNLMIQRHKEGVDCDECNDDVDSDEGYDDDGYDGGNDGGDDGRSCIVSERTIR